MKKWISKSLRLFAFLIVLTIALLYAYDYHYTDRSDPVLGSHGEIANLYFYVDYGGYRNHGISVNDRESIAQFQAALVSGDDTLTTDTFTRVGATCAVDIKCRTLRKTRNYIYAGKAEHNRFLITSADEQILGDLKYYWIRIDGPTAEIIRNDIKTVYRNVQEKAH